MNNGDTADFDLEKQNGIKKRIVVMTILNRLFYGNGQQTFTFFFENVKLYLEPFSQTRIHISLKLF